MILYDLYEFRSRCRRYVQLPFSSNSLNNRTLKRFLWFILKVHRHWRVEITVCLATFISLGDLKLKFSRIPVLRNRSSRRMENRPFPKRSFYSVCHWMCYTVTSTQPGIQDFIEVLLAAWRRCICKTVVTEAVQKTCDFSLPQYQINIGFLKWAHENLGILTWMTG